jgi:hypothetical protein
MFPDEDGEWFCLTCGERVYDGHGAFIDRLLDAMERRMLKDGFELQVPPHPGREWAQRPPLSRRGGEGG